MMIRLFSGIRLRLALIFLVCFTMMATLGVFLLQRNLLSNFLEIEQDAAVEDMTRAIYGLHNELRYVKIIISDWGDWDELYQFTLTRQTEFYQTNLNEKSLKTASLSVLQINDPQNRVISFSQQGFSPKSSPKLFAPENNHSTLSELSGLPYKRNCGFLKTPAGLMSSCWRLILHSDGSGPASGILMMARLVEKEHLEFTRKGLQLSFSVEPAAPPSPLRWTLKNRPTPDMSKEISVQMTDKKLTLRYPLLDTNGQHINDIQLTLPRKILLEGQGVILSVSLELIGIAMLCCIILMVYVHYSLVRPLSQLQTSLAQVRVDHNWATLIPSASNDEIGLLGQEINGLLKVINHQVEHLENLSLTDSLCNLANRRAFDLQLTQELNRCQRLKYPLALLIIDIDFFKQYNDLYGHPAGDLALQTVAKTLKSVFLRVTDLPARIGGEEFAVLLPNTDEAGALQGARALQTLLKQCAIPHQASQVSDFLTISIGLTSYDPNQPQNAETLIAQADQQLYQAKNAGRNQICVHSKTSA